MIIHCVRCGETQMVRKARRNGFRSTLATHKRMTSEIQGSFLNSCPDLCLGCLNDLYHFVNSPEHKRRQERNSRLARAALVA